MFWVATIHLQDLHLPATSHPPTAPLVAECQKSGGFVSDPKVGHRLGFLTESIPGPQKYVE